MPKKAIIILSGGLVKNEEGIWRTLDFTDGGDRFGVTGDHLRIMAGKYLFAQDPSAVIIVSGFKGYLLNIPDAPAICDIMADELINLGIPADHIIKENHSNNSYENLLESAPLIRQLGATQALIITNRWHTERIEAFLKLRSELSASYGTIQTKVIAAEDVVIAHNPSLKGMIDTAYKSLAMQKRITLEKNGIEQIKKGTYRLHYQHGN